jgi:hypothetical protein
MNVDVRPATLGALLCNYTALHAAQVADTPFPHLLVQDFVPPAALETVYADMPRQGGGGSYPPEALKLGPSAKALMREMEGHRLRTAIAEKFALDLADAPTMLTVRVACRQKDGQIHTDSDAKRVTVLLYLNPPARNSPARMAACACCAARTIWRTTKSKYPPPAAPCWCSQTAPPPGTATAPTPAPATPSSSIT